MRFTRMSALEVRVASERLFHMALLVFDGLLDKNQ